MRDKRLNNRQRRLIQLVAEMFAGKQVALAEYAGISANLISRYINGSKGIGEDMREKIEMACGLPDRWLDQDNESKDPVQVASRKKINSKHMAMIELFDGLTEAQQKEFFRELEEKKRQNDTVIAELTHKPRRAG